MNLTPNQLQSALAKETRLRAIRFEAVGQLLRQSWAIDQQLHTAQILLIDSDRELRRHNKQQYRATNRAKKGHQ